MTNLWPDFSTETVVDSPKQIVEEAGAGVKEKTAGKIVFYYDGLSIDNDKATARYNLYAANLSYHYPFARLTFPLKDSYPAEFFTSDNSRPLVANNREELLAGLSDVFRSDATVNIIRQLLALMK